MKKNLTKKLMLSVLTLAFAVVSLGASTFAWFTLSKDAEVESFEMEVKGGAGLEIQAVKIGEDFQANGWQTNSLDKSFITNLFESGTKLDSVTPSSAFTGNAATFTGITGTETINKNQYVEFKLGLRLSDKNDTNKYPISFNGYTLETVDAANVAKWYSNKVYKDASGADVALNTEKTYYVSDAARLGFYANTATAGEISKIYETNSTVKSAEFTSGFQANGALSYYNAVNQTTVELPAAPVYTSEAAWAEVELGTLTGGVDANANDTIEEAERQVIVIVIRVWIEGWDGEAINAIFQQKLSSSLSFYLDNENPVA